ncbi:MAG TPA: acylneuraminate cytidylyltransferase [Anaerolineaceae bacterium]|nr:acylneuraminate cytidylyltransferase [Anaerolineaceae bacterium]
MVDRPEVLAIIPARGGSKGLPRKNIRPFAGFPLIAYSIAAGKSAECVTRTLVSTDDEEIASVGREFGADVPFLRPAELAQDNTTDLPVFRHALDWLAREENYHPAVVVQLRPTSPIRPRRLVDEAVSLLLSHPEADSVRGVMPAGQNPHKMWRLDPAGGPMRPLLAVDGIAEPYNAPRQVLPPVFWQTGHVDAIRPATILAGGSMSGKVILPVMVEPRYTVDIDSLFDLQRAEWLVYHAGLDMVDPARRRRPLPAKISLIVFDFDGVLTDNRVFTDENGRETVASNRSDSLGLTILRSKRAIDCLILSREHNPVVSARASKINLPVIQSVSDKETALNTLILERGLDPAEVIYLGNDVNDLPCLPLVGCFIAPSDAHPEVLRRADIVLQNPGGRGAVRELCDWLLHLV